MSSSKAHKLIIDFIQVVSSRHDLTPHALAVVNLAFRDEGRSEFLRVLELRALHLKMQEVMGAIRERGIKIPFTVEESPDWGAWRKKGQYCR